MIFKKSNLDFTEATSFTKEMKDSFHFLNIGDIDKKFNPI